MSTLSLQVIALNCDWSLDHNTPLIRNCTSAFTGAHAGFYEKFQFRNSTSEIIDYCWPMSGHRQSLLSFASDPVTQPHFLRFVNAVTNDVNFHIEDALKWLGDIREVEKLQDDAASWAAMPSDDRKEKESRLNGAYNSGRSALYFTMEQFCLMALVTEHTAKVWLCKDIRLRLATALGYVLDQFVGSARSSLRVKNMGKLQFKPLEVLLPLVTVYGNLADGGPFAGADDEELQVRKLSFSLNSMLFCL